MTSSDTKDFAYCMDRYTDVTCGSAACESISGKEKVVMIMEDCILILFCLSCLVFSLKLRIFSAMIFFLLFCIFSLG